MAAKVAKVLIRFSKGDMTVAELAHSTLYISPKRSQLAPKNKVWCARLDLNQHSSKMATTTSR